eukprot:TRINITY_DN17084_c0_g1_i4.p1 TRINITY_DN17084_c0_g1~~TRINITY_DN17084_c0_g1_i4.p1  ORF type:complete len:749 (-),score=178.59 TRINITY_DN17084_c0_g1_i4:368-2551(-)
MKRSSSLPCLLHGLPANHVGAQQCSNMVAELPGTILGEITDTLKELTRKVDSLTRRSGWKDSLEQKLADRRFQKLQKETEEDEHAEEETADLQEALENKKFIKARVNAWFVERGFGFVQCQGRKAFCHATAVRGGDEALKVDSVVMVKIMNDLSRAPGQLRVAEAWRPEGLAEERRANKALAKAELMVKTAELARKAAENSRHATEEVLAHRPIATLTRPPGFEPQTVTTEAETRTASTASTTGLAKTLPETLEDSRGEGFKRSEEPKAPLTSRRKTFGTTAATSTSSSSRKTDKLCGGTEREATAKAYQKGIAAIRRDGIFTNVAASASVERPIAWDDVPKNVRSFFDPDPAPSQTKPTTSPFGAPPSSTARIGLWEMPTASIFWSPFSATPPTGERASTTSPFGTSPFAPSPAKPTTSPFGTSPSRTEDTGPWGAPTTSASPSSFHADPPTGKATSTSRRASAFGAFGSGKKEAAEDNDKGGKDLSDCLDAFAEISDEEFPRQEQELPAADAGAVSVKKTTERAARAGVTLDDKAKAVLDKIGPEKTEELLGRTVLRGSEIRNPSAYVYRAARRLTEELPRLGEDAASSGDEDQREGPPGGAGGEGSAKGPDDEERWKAERDDARGEAEEDDEDWEENSDNANQDGEYEDWEENSDNANQDGEYEDWEENSDNANQDGEHEYWEENSDNANQDGEHEYWEENSDNANQDGEYEDWEEAWDNTDEN